MSLAGLRLLAVLLVAAGSAVSATGCSSSNPSGHSAARLWNEEMLAAIRRDTPRPTVHARNLYHVSAAMYDAWAVYEPAAETVFDHEPIPPAAGRGAREKAISYAAYRLLSHRFARSPGHEDSQAAFDALMAALGHDIFDVRTDGSSPAAVGNRIAQRIIALTLEDGANEAEDYADTGGYQPINGPLIVEIPGSGGMNDINRWQPLWVPDAPAPQGFLSPHWGGVVPFALDDPAALLPAPPPRLGLGGETEIREDVLQLLRYSNVLDPDDGVLIDISPGTVGNNPLGTQDGSGHALNPVTGQPYPENRVRRGDWGRCLAEFWADGPRSSTPPGHWNEIANEVSEHPQLQRRIGGHGAPVDRLEWDVKLYVALNGALHDAAIVTWKTKAQYDFVRPISLIREMAALGQSSDSDLPAFHPWGLPLEAGLVEQVTADSSAPGQRHAHLAAHVGEIAVKAWQGHPADPAAGHGGVDWIRGVEWLPYQQFDFVTPPFAGYTSGHSAFSRAAAEILTLFTGSAFFPGGLGEFAITATGDGFGLSFELGPSEDMVLQWATYADAADEAGISRIYGGIHPAVDDFAGRAIGFEVGYRGFDRALQLFGPGAGGWRVSQQP